MFEIILLEPKIGYKKCTFEDGSSGIVQILISKGSSVYFTGPNDRLVFSLTNPGSFKVLKILNDTISIPFPCSIESKNDLISPNKISSFPGDDKKVVVFWRPETAAFFFV